MNHNTKCKHPSVVEGNTGYFCKLCGGRVGEFLGIKHCSTGGK